MNLELSKEVGFVKETTIMQFDDAVLKRYPIDSFMGIPQFNIPVTLIGTASDGKVRRRLDKLGVVNCRLKL